MYIAHSSEFAKPGAYRSIDTAAGYPIFLIRGKDDIIRAFHNVCRHRAYAVITKSVGSSLVLGCRYHGWSYDTKGKLVKAPKFDKVPGFDKVANSLFEVRTYTDRNGLVFVNLDMAGEVVPPISGEEIAAFGVTTAVIETWDVEGLFNWKFAGLSQQVFHYSCYLHMNRR